jgi:hypothetical protein
MAKLAFSKLGLKLQDEIKTIELDNQVIEIKQYLSLDEKTSLISKVINECWDENAKFYNPCKYEVLIDFEIIKAYTNIVFTEKQERDNFSKTYDILNSNGLIKRILDLVPIEEYDFIKQGTIEAIQSIYKYSNSIFGIVETIKEDYGNLDLDATSI